MLDQLDVLIGLSLVLAGAGMIVTLAVQAVASLLALRGSNLLWGVRLLLKELDPEKKIQEEANAIAEAALRHPLVSDSIGSTRRWLETRAVVGWFARRWNLATAVREEELIAVLKRLAAPTSNLPAELQQKLRAATAGGLDELRLWFDSTMDRASQRFTTHARIATVAGSFLLAFGLQIDALDLQSRLAAEPALRAAMVAEAEQRAGNGSDSLEPAYAARALESVLSEPERTGNAAAVSEARSVEDARLLLPAIAGTDAARLHELQSQLEVALTRERGAAIRAEAMHMVDLCAIRLPGDRRCPPVAGPHFLGMLASALLLCLGAPFWFNVLKSLVDLRPVLARKTNGN